MRDKEGHYIVIKRSIQQEDISFPNIYTLNIGAPKYIKQILTYIKGEVDNKTVRVRNINTPLKKTSIK